MWESEKERERSKRKTSSNQKNNNVNGAVALGVIVVSDKCFKSIHQTDRYLTTAYSPIRIFPQYFYFSCHVNSRIIYYLYFHVEHVFPPTPTQTTFKSIKMVAINKKIFTFVFEFVCRQNRRHRSKGKWQRKKDEKT